MTINIHNYDEYCLEAAQEIRDGSLTLDKAIIHIMFWNEDSEPEEIERTLINLIIKEYTDEHKRS